jgi:hypothetical protein
VNLPKDKQKPDKNEQRAAAERSVAEFLAKGRTIQRGPDVVPTLLVCRNCGAPSTIGIAASQRRSARCPKCGAIAV